jgi:hypothetical protein
MLPLTNNNFPQFGVNLIASSLAQLGIGIKENNAGIGILACQILVWYQTV